MTVSNDLDRRFREAADAGRPARRCIRRRRLADRPALRRGHRSRDSPDLVRRRSRARARPPCADRRTQCAASAACGRPRAPRAQRIVPRRRQGFDLSLDLRGATPSRSKVLDELAQVPYGHTTTYGAARRSGRPPTSRPRDRHGDEPQPDPDRASLPPNHRFEREPRRLRRRARPEGAPPPSRGRAPLRDLDRQLRTEAAMCRDQAGWRYRPRHRRGEGAHRPASLVPSRLLEEPVPDAPDVHHEAVAFGETELAAEATGMGVDRSGQSIGAEAPHLAE